jgi:type IV fimbrial biogenesis protein FimT
MVSPAPRRAARGFTLVEMMIVVVILAVFAAVARPAYTSLVAGMRIRAAGSDLFTTLLRARSEAVKRNVEILIEPVSSLGWEQGWRIQDPGTGSALEQHGAITLTQISGPASVIYQTNGRIKAGTAPSFEISSSASDKRRCVALDLSGRPYEKDGRC